VFEDVSIDSHPWQWCDDVTACLCLPESVDNRATFFANDLVVPEPSFGVDGLTNASKNSENGFQVSTEGNSQQLINSLQALKIVLQHWFIAKLHQRSDGRRSRVELRDLILVDDLPVTVVVWIERRSLKLRRCEKNDVNSSKSIKIRFN
jgi:hypothetical protein